MRNYFKVLVALFLSFFVLDCYAIQVSVQATSSAVQALGFTVNGHDHGFLGHHYSASNLPTGKYTFGVRVRGSNVGCPASNGKSEIMLNNDTMAVLNYNGKQCTASITALKK